MKLTKHQWELIEKLLPQEERTSSPKAEGERPWRDAREVLEGVLWVLKTGADWSHLPDRFPPYQICHRRFQKWVDQGVLPRILAKLRQDLCSNAGVQTTEAHVDGTQVPSKEGDLAWDELVAAFPPRSWQSRTAMIFHSLCVLEMEQDTTVCSQSELSKLASWKLSHRD